MLHLGLEATMYIKSKHKIYNNYLFSNLIILLFFILINININFERLDFTSVYKHSSISRLNIKEGNKISEILKNYSNIIDSINI